MVDNDSVKVTLGVKERSLDIVTDFDRDRSSEGVTVAVEDTESDMLHCPDEVGERVGSTERLNESEGDIVMLPESDMVTSLESEADCVRSEDGVTECWETVRDVDRERVGVLVAIAATGRKGEFGLLITQKRKTYNNKKGSRIDCWR